MKNISFTPSKFRLLCSTLDSILLSSLNPYVISIDWLHVLRPHSVLLKRYKSLFSPISSQLWYLFLDICRNIVSVLIDIKQAILNGHLLMPHLSVSSPPDIIFVTHLLDASHLRKSTDFYYGDLGDQLSQEGLSVLFLFINHTKLPSKLLQSSQQFSNYNRIVLPVGQDSLSLLFRSLYWSIKSFIRLLSCMPRIRSYRILHSVVLAASNSFSRGTRLSFFLQYYLKHLIRPNTKCLVSTFEGFAWERIVFSTSHDHNPSISTFGYMHALSFKDQHSVFRSLGNRFNPRFILTAGSISRDYLLKYLGFCESQVFELGSPRSITVPGVLESSPASSSSTILVLPEGILDECLLLFRFSLECALHNPSLIFRWRTHPLIPVESVVSNIIGNSLLPSNIVVSNESFDSDISASRYCLYRGSTAVVTAASSGLIPIYYKFSDFPDTDPLFCLSSYRPAVSQFYSLSNVLQWTRWDSSAIKLCQQLYTPLNHHLFMDHGLL